MHRINAIDNKEASYDDYENDYENDFESSFSSLNPIDDFWSNQYEFPGKGDGGLLGESNDNLPPAMIVNESSNKRNNTQQQQQQYYNHDPISKYLDKPQRRIKKSKHSPIGLSDQTQDIYRLGPSLEKQWWKVKRDKPKKKRRHKRKKHNDRDQKQQQVPVNISYSKSLPQIRSGFTPEHLIANAILTTNHDYDHNNQDHNQDHNHEHTREIHTLPNHHQKTTSNHIYHDEPHQHQHTTRTPITTSTTRTTRTTRTTGTRTTGTTPTISTPNGSKTKLRRTNGTSAPSILNVPYGQEVLDLDPPIMARTVDPFVVRYFSILDLDGSGTLRKRHLIHAARHSWKIREYLHREASPPMRQLCRRPGFVGGLAALRTSDPTLVTYPEFRDYCLGLTERREAEIAQEIRREKLQRRKVRRKRKVAREEAIRAAEEDLKANSLLAEASRRIELQMERTQAECDKEKEMLGEFRVDAEKGINASKRFAGSTRKKATNKAMEMVKEGAERAREKEEAAIHLDEQLRARRTRQEVQMRRVTNNAKTKVLEVTIEARAEAEEIIKNAQEEADQIRKLGHEKALDEQRHIEERRKLAEDVIESARTEALSIRNAERKKSQEAHDSQIELIQTMKQQALEECGSMKRRAEEAAASIERRAEEAGKKMQEQIQTEQELWRQRAFEEKEAAVKQARSDMVLVLDRAKQKSEETITSAKEKAAEIIANGKKEAQELYRNAKANAENQEALNKLKGSVRADTERKLKEMEKKANDRQALEQAAMKRSRRRRSVAMGESLKQLPQTKM